MGGGAPSIPQRNLQDELNQIFKKGLPLDLKAYQNFWQGEPLLSGAHDYALSNLQNVGQLTDPIMKLFGSLPGQIGNIAGQVGGVAGNIGDVAGQVGDVAAMFPGLFDQAGRLSGQLGSLYKSLPNVQSLTNPLQRQLNNMPDIKGLTNPLQRILASLGSTYANQINPILARGGRLTPEQENDVTQGTRAAFAARGNLMGNQAVGAELLDRDKYRRDRFNEALGQGLGISGEERGLTGGIEGLRTQDILNRLGLTRGIGDIRSQDIANRLGITQGEGNILNLRGNLLGTQGGLLGTQGGLLGQQGGMLGEQAGLLGQEGGVAGSLAGILQSLQQGAIGQATGVENAQIGSYASLINPLLAYGQNVGESNQNAAAAQSIAGGNKSSGLLGGGMSALGGIAGGIGMAL